MAEIVETDGPPRRRTHYPWHEWTDGLKRRARQGVDFDTSEQNFQNALHQRARAYGMKVITGCPEDGVVEFVFSKEITDAEV